MGHRARKLLSLLLLTFSFLAPLRAVAAEAPAAPVVVAINSEIDDHVADAIEAKVAEAVKAGQTTLTVRINSPGGSIFDGLNIIRILSESGLYTTCEVDGLAASMAAAILESPACNVRLVHPWSVLMFHEGGLVVMGGMRQNDAEAISVALRAMNRALATLIAPRLGLSLDDYLARTTGGRQVWIAGLDAVGQHAADAVVGQQSDQQGL